MASGISTIISFVTKYAGAGAEAAANGIGKVKNAAGIAMRGISQLGTVVGGLDGKFSVAANGAMNMISSIQQMGAIGGIMAGAQMAITMISQHFIDKAKEMEETVKKAGEKIRNRLEEMNKARMDGVEKALDKATTKAQEAAKAFDTLASAYLKVQKAKAETEKANAATVLSGLSLEKSKEMAGAKNDAERESIGAKYDEKIARAKLAATTSEQSSNVDMAETELTDAKYRAKKANWTEDDAMAAVEKARKIYERDVVTNNDGNVKKSKEAVEKAEKALAEAVNDRITKEADAEAAEEKLKQAKLNQTAAIDNARKELTDAESASRKLAESQKKSAYQKSGEKLDVEARKKQEDIALTHKQTKAELELAIAKAKALGKEKEVAKLEAKAKDDEAKARTESAAASIEAAKKRLSLASGMGAKETEDAKRALTTAEKESQVVKADNQKTRLSDNIATASGKREAATSERDKWQERFNEAFDLWRDPEAAQQAVDADKKRGEDMKAFRKAVNRYGGKGKIDEYARLMREGDEEGMQDRLAQWRKSSKFTPQVEQMVKAAAADQNKNAAEKSLAQIEKNTGDLAKKIDQLLSLK